MTPAPPYPVERIEPAWRSEPESMGARSKFWYRRADTPNSWLFKFPREGTGEHWSEKIAAEVASCIDVLHGRVELAEFESKRGSTTESFVRSARELRHGNEVLAATIPDYNRTRRFQQYQHTLENIWRAFDRLYGEPVGVRRARHVFASYLILDAVIGNTDRHHENWGIQVRHIGSKFRIRIAPSFDHASSLGRELSDEQRKRRLREGKIGDYAERGRGGIYRSEADNRAPSPLDLVRRSSRDDPSLFGPILERVSAIGEQEVRGLVNRVPEDWMSGCARDFAIALMCYNLKELQRLIQ